MMVRFGMWLMLTGLKIVSKRANKVDGLVRLNWSNQYGWDGHESVQQLTIEQVNRSAGQKAIWSVD